MLTFGSWVQSQGYPAFTLVVAGSVLYVKHHGFGDCKLLTASTVHHY